MYYNQNNRKFVMINENETQYKDLFVREIGHSLPPLGTTVELLPRNVYTIHFAVSGSGKFDGTEIRQGQGYFVPPNQAFSINIEKKFEQYWIMVGGNKACELLYEMDSSNSKHLFEANFFRHIKFDFDLVLSRERATNFNTELLMMSTLYKLMSVLNSNKEKTEEHMNRYVRICCDFIEQHYSEKISVEDIAAASHISSKYMYKLFMKELGISPKKMLITKRLEYGKYLLQTTSMTLDDIAVASGYSCASRFIYALKQQFGVSPSDFRAHIL